MLALRVIENRLAVCAVHSKSASIEARLEPFVENTLMRMAVSGAIRPDQDPLELTTNGLVGGYSRSLQLPKLVGINYALRRILQEQGLSPFEQPVSGETAMF